MEEDSEDRNRGSRSEDGEIRDICIRQSDEHVKEKERECVWRDDY